MKRKLKLGISACLLGEKVRYDGGHKLNRFIAETLGRQFAFLPVCPEAGSGLSVPRETMQLSGDPGSPRLVTIGTRIDHTERLSRWVEQELSGLEKQGLSGFIFKARSPSCALCDAEIFALSGELIGKGPGIFARIVTRRFPSLPVIDEESLADTAVRGNFIERVYSYRRRIDLVPGAPSL